MTKIITQTSHWKPVEFGADNLSVEGLIGIEELTDYTLEDGLPKAGAKRPKKRPKKAAKRRKAEDGPRAPEGQESGGEPTDYLAWENLHVPRELARPLVESGFINPTEIQTQSIPAAIKGRRDILGAAETGSGKTLAFGIPIIYGILKNLEREAQGGPPPSDESPALDGSGSEFESDQDEAAPRSTGCVRVRNLGFVPKSRRSPGRLWALVLTPTRELAIQVKNHLQLAAKYTPVKVAVIVGGMSSEKQTRVLSKSPHIVVATPGRLWELVSSNDPHLSNIEDVRFLAIDETDRMLEKDHFPELKSLLEKLNSDPAKTKLRQNFVFSATLTFVHEPPQHLVKKRKKVKRVTPGQKLQNIMETLGITDPKTVDLTRKTGTAEGLQESRITCKPEEKDVYLFAFLAAHPGRTLVFLNSVSSVRRLTSVLNLLGTNPRPLHANMHQRQRLNNLDRFKADSKGLLLATDVAARGLDIPSIQHVVHYHVPRTSESYIHRSGRTARAEKDGLTVLLIDPTEVNLYAKICNALGRDCDIPEFPLNERVFLWSKERVALAREVDLLELKSRKITSSAGWIERAAMDMDIVLDDDQMPNRPDSVSEARHRKLCRGKRQALRRLLSEPCLGSDSATALESLRNSTQNLRKYKKPIFKVIRTNNC